MRKVAALMKNPAVHLPSTIREGSLVEEFDYQRLVLDKLILISLNYIKKIAVLMKNPVVHLSSTIREGSPVEEGNTTLYFLKSES